MSASDPAVQDHNKAQMDRISTELMRAKARQRVLYLVAAVLLLLTLVTMLAIIAFSNATPISVEPEEAKPRAEVQVVEGWAAALGHTVYALGSNPAIEVSAEGFVPLRKTLQNNEIGGVVTVELAELPGRLEMSTKPQSELTRWFVDGQLVAAGLQLSHEDVAGEHLVEIDSPYYLKKRLPVSLKRGELVNLNLDLEAVSGQLHINTMPAGATVKIDGEMVGKSPLSLTRAGGQYMIEVSHDRYQSITERIAITNSESSIERSYHLAHRQARLQVRVTPAGGELLLNGKRVSASKPLTVKADTANALIYLKDGYFPERKTVAIAAGEEQSIALNLKPELGRVRIVSKPAARVSIDGKAMGTTPLELMLPAVSQTVEVHKTGYRSYRETVKPSSRSVRNVEVKLKTVRQALLAESPPQYRNIAGIEMKMFQPNERFVMGAPRHEKGQRANEFLREVWLDKPFYVSRHEVTRSQYSRYRPAQGSGSEPVTSISWMEAAAYCNWLSQQEKRPPFYRISNGQLQGFNIASDGYRLVSEAEWEWLARKASRAVQSRFTWGDETTIPSGAGNIADEHAKGSVAYYVPNYSDGYAAVAPVGSFSAEVTGLYDMTGNVSEWVHDIYALLPGDANITHNPMGEQRGDTHVVKGSSWRSGRITELRASYREGEKEGRSDIGFRVARYLYGGANEDE